MNNEELRKQNDKLTKTGEAECAEFEATVSRKATPDVIEAGVAGTQGAPSPLVPDEPSSPLVQHGSRVLNNAKDMIRATLTDPIDGKN